MLKLGNIEYKCAFEKIMPLCLALFFCRTVFIGYKYLFFLTLVPCVVYSAYWLLKNGMVKPKWSKLLLPLLVIALFFANFTPISNVVKESMNIWLILYFVVLADLYFVGGNTDALLKWIVRLIMVAGVVAIARKSFMHIGVQMPLSNILFEGGGYSLVNDYNFYSLFFILALLLAFGLFINEKFSVKEYVVVYIISLTNIVLSVSRRGYILFVTIIIIISVYSIYKYRGNKKILSVCVTPIILSLCGCILGVLCFLNVANKTNISYEVKHKYYKLQTLFEKNLSFEEFDFKLRRKHINKRFFAPGDNLFYNGDFANGLDDWGYISGPNDCIGFNLVEDGTGSNAVRIVRDCNNSGYWQVYYTGRPILYHKNVTYNLSFSYRVLEGPERPFCVGWWINEGQGYIYNLPQTINVIDSIWSHCMVSYRFKENHLNPICFLNSLQAGSTIEIKDISLICNDTDNLPMYADQLSDSEIHSYLDTVNYLTHTRTDRWRYALELWQTRYDTKQKIFGQGFKYLEWYGEKFYGNPKRHDFPHNPIISSFLYSGIIGGIVYIIFLIASLWLYWKRRKELGIFFIMYLCCMFFCMFSGSSHFSFPLFAFLSFLPFVEYRKDVKHDSIVAE